MKTNTRTSILHVMVGTSGAGKSTYAREKLFNDNTRIVGRDKIRETFFGYTEESISKYWERSDVMDLEKEVNKFQKKAIESVLSLGFDCVIDNTHLRMSYINKIISDFYYCIIKFHLVEQPYEVCIERCQQRTRKVEETFIKKQFSELKKLKSEFDFKTYVPDIKPISIDEAFDKIIIFDLDNTFSIMCDRNPYDSSRVLNDTLCLEVYSIYKAFKNEGYKICICTGRSKDAEIDSKYWLSINDIQYDEFYIRNENDYRPDYIVKEEFWHDISKKYHIWMLVDDRNSVVNHSRRLGLKCIQVEEGNF